MATPLNVTFHRVLDTKCHCIQKPYVFSYPFPNCSPDCDHLNTIFSTLPIVLKPTILETLRIRLVMASSFSAITWNDSSIINLIHRNDAQISIPALSISYRRWGAVKFLPALRSEEPLIVSRKPVKLPVSLHPKSLAPPNLRAIGGLVLLWFAIGKLNPRNASYWRCFLTHVFFELLSSHITTLFNKPIPDRAVITKDGEFAELLASGKYRALFRSTIFDELLGKFFVQVGIVTDLSQSPVCRTTIAVCLEKPLFTPRESFKRVQARVEQNERLLLFVSANNAPYFRSCGVDLYIDRSTSMGYESYAYHPSSAGIWR